MHRALIVLAAVLVVVAVVATPALIAALRRHPERTLIFRLSPLSAVSFALWLVLIVWASSNVRNDAVISRYVHRLRESNRFTTLIGALLLVGLVTAVVSIRK